MGVARCDGDNALDDCKAVEEEGGGEVDGCGHGAPVVDAEEIGGQGDVGWGFRVKFADYETVLVIQACFCHRVYYVDWGGFS